MPQEHVLCDMLRVDDVERLYRSEGRSGDSNQYYGREVSDLPALHVQQALLLVLRARALARALRARECVHTYSICPRRPRAREHINKYRERAMNGRTFTS